MHDYSYRGQEKLDAVHTLRLLSIHFILSGYKPRKERSSWKLWLLCEDKLRELRRELDNGTPTTQVKSFLSLPTNEAHKNHPTGGEIAFARKVHPLLVTKSSELVSANIRHAWGKKLLKYHTDTQLSKELRFKPQAHDRAFYPNNRYQESSLPSQESTFFLAMSQWKLNPNHHLLQRYLKVEKKTEMKEFQGNSGEFLGSHGQCSQTFLYVHQIQWQKKMLGHYGNNISLIDATYKATR